MDIMFRCVSVWCAVNSEGRNSFPSAGMDTDHPSQCVLTKVSKESMQLFATATCDKSDDMHRIVKLIWSRYQHYKKRMFFNFDKKVQQ